MKIITAIKKDGKIKAKVETDAPLWTEININTGEVKKQSSEKLVLNVEINDLHDDDLNKYKIISEVEKIVAPENIIYENTPLDSAEIKEKAKKKDGLKVVS